MTRQADRVLHEAMQGTTEALVAAQTAEEAVTAFLDHLGGALGLGTAWVFRLDPDLRVFRPAAWVGLPPALARDAVAPLRCGGCECQRRFRRGELGGAVNIVTCSRLEDSVGDRGGLSLHASLPLRQGTRVLGILNVAAPGPEPLGAPVLATLEVAARALAVALDRAALWQVAERRLAGMARVAEALAVLAHAPTSEELEMRALRLVLAATRAEVAARVRPDGRVHCILPESVALLGPGVERGAMPHAAWESGRVWRVHGPRVAARSRSGIWTLVSADAGWLVAEHRMPDGLDDADADVLLRLAGGLGEARAALAARETVARRAVRDERRRIARDLHDRVSQRLFSASLAVSSATALVGGGRLAEARTSLSVAAAQLRSAQDEMRGLVEALEPVREEADVVGSLAELAASMQAVDGPRIESRLGKVPPETSPEVRAAVVRIAAEALHNAVRHAHAGTVRLTLTRRGRWLVLTIEDDGVGMPARRVRSGLGLAHLRDRAREVGGRVRITARSQTLGTGGPAGTRVRAWLPWTDRMPEGTAP